MKIELIKGKIFELDPNKTYIIEVSNRAITRHNANILRRQLIDIGIVNTLVVVTEGDGSSLNIIESVKK